MKGNSNRRASMSSRGDSDESNQLYASDDFRIYCMKVLPCSKRFCHDWTRCPFAHTGEKARRRDPRVYNYTGIACPDMKSTGTCPRKENCPMSHSAFEFWLHPSRYRTQLCKDGTKCNRHVCFFAHTVAELRVPAAKTVAPLEELQGETQPLGASLPPQGDNTTALLLAALMDRLPPTNKVAAYLASLEGEARGRHPQGHSASNSLASNPEGSGVNELLRSILQQHTESNAHHPSLTRLQSVPSAPDQLLPHDLGLDLSMAHRSTSCSDPRAPPTPLGDVRGSSDYNSTRGSFGQVHLSTPHDSLDGRSYFSGSTACLPLASHQEFISNNWQQERAAALSAFQQQGPQGQGSLTGRPWGPSPEFLQGMAQGLKLPGFVNPQQGFGHAPGGISGSASSAAMSGQALPSQWESPLSMPQDNPIGAFNQGHQGPFGEAQPMEGRSSWSLERQANLQWQGQQQADAQDMNHGAQNRVQSPSWMTQQDGMPQGTAQAQGDPMQGLHYHLPHINPPQHGSSPPNHHGHRSSMESTQRSSMDSASDNHRMSLDHQHQHGPLGGGREGLYDQARLKPQLTPLEELDEAHGQSSSGSGDAKKESAPNSPQEWLSRLASGGRYPVPQHAMGQDGAQSLQGPAKSPQGGSQHAVPTLESLAANSLFSSQPTYNHQADPKTVLPTSQQPQ